MSKIYTCLSVKIIPCSDIFLGVAQALAIFKVYFIKKDIH